MDAGAVDAVDGEDGDEVAGGAGAGAFLVGVEVVADEGVEVGAEEFGRQGDGLFELFHEIHLVWSSRGDDILYSEIK